MVGEADVTIPGTGSGDALLAALRALASPYRLRIVAALVGRRQYVSELAREMGMSRTLLHMHLRRLQAAGLVSSTLELSADGKAMNFLSVTPFAIGLTPDSIAGAVETLTERPAAPDGDEKED
jgi:DNA-binding transcriptional ArsR family regulator